jgi:hypothetical protein
VSTALESHIRRKARRLGFRVLKSRGRLHSHNFGEFQLVEDNVVLLGSDYDATLDDIHDFLTHQVPADV